MKILLAVSGGIDSMFMAERFLATDGAGAIAVAHCNFGLRGAESDGDEAFVRDWCSRKGVEFIVKRFDTSKYAVEKGISIEMAAREQRYAWFAELCRERGFSCVAVAHNADDNAETLFLNLLRGTGGRGLRGMQARGTVPGAPDVVLIRPLLGMTRKEIAEWMTAAGAGWREDSTNAGSVFKRNKIRNKVFPLLKEMNPSFIKTLTRSMGYFSQENDIADDYYQEHRDQVFSDGRIDVPALLGLKHWEYVLYRIAEPFGFNMQVIDAIGRSLKEPGQLSGKIFTGDGYKMVSSSDALIISDIKQGEKLTGLSVDKCGDYGFNGSTVSIRLYPRTPDMALEQPVGTLIFDADKVPFPFTLRTWQKGDWLNPLGLRGKKKLSDMFTDLKFSLLDKDDAIVLQTAAMQEGHIGALIGQRIDDSLKVTPETDTVLMIRLTK